MYFLNLEVRRPHDLRTHALKAIMDRTLYQQKAMWMNIQRDRETWRHRDRYNPTEVLWTPVWV